MALEAWCQRNQNVEWLARLVVCQALARVDIFILRCVARLCAAVGNLLALSIILPLYGHILSICSAAA